MMGVGRTRSARFVAIYTVSLSLTSSSGLGGGGGNVALSILRSWAFFFPALDFAFFPMIKQIGDFE